MTRPARRKICARFLFRDQLGLITPLLWLAYIAGSMAVFYFATWGPIVAEA